MDIPAGMKVELGLAGLREEEIVDWDGRVIWWNPTTGKPIKEMTGTDARGSPQKIAIAADGRTLAAVSRRGAFRRA